MSSNKQRHNSEPVDLICLQLRESHLNRISLVRVPDLLQRNPGLRVQLLLFYSVGDDLCCGVSLLFSWSPLGEGEDQVPWSDSSDGDVGFEFW